MSSTVERTNEEDILKILVEQASTGVCIMQDGKFCYINSVFSSDTGYTANELVGKDSFKIVVPEDREMVRENTVKMLKGELISPYQFRVICKDGSIRWVMAAVKSVQYHGRRAILGNYMEITWHKQIEDALKESEERYREIANSITDVFFAMDEHLRYTYWNKASEVLTGIRAEDAIGKSIGEIFPDTPWRKRAEKVYRKVLRTQQPQTFMNDYDIDGRHYIFEISAYPSRGGISVFVSDKTERKQAEEALRQSEERYRTMLEEMEEGYYEVNIAGNFTFVSDAMCRILGYSRDELIGMNYKTYTPKEDVKTTFEAYNRVYRTGEPLKWFPMVEVRKDGTRVLVEDSVLPMRNDEGEVIGFRGISRDVTESKRAEEALEVQRAYFQQLFDNSPDAILMTDTNSKVIQANRGSELLFGYSNEEVKGQTLTELIVPEVDVQEASDSFQRILGGEVIRKESVRRRKDGSLVDVSILAYPIRSNDKLIGLYGIYSDISERKQAEEELRQSEERYRALFDSSVIGTLLLDAETMQVLMGNEAALKTFGFSSLEEGAGINVLDFVPKEDRELNRELIKKELFEQDSRRNYDVRAITKYGREIWINVTGVRMMYKGRLVGMVTFTDVTERKQAEEALRQSEEKYRTILEEMEDAYFEVDLGGHFTFVNDSVCRDLGYSSEELIGMSYKNFTVEEDIESVFRIFNEVYQTGVPNKGFPWRTIRKDGIQGFAETSVSPLRNEKGEIIGFRGVGRDITERKQTEEKLQQSRENYQALFDSSVIGALVVDAETMKVVIANQAALKMFGFSSPEAGVNPLDFSPPEDRQRNLELIVKEVFEKDSRGSIDLPVMTKDGRNIWVSVTGARIMHKSRLAALLSFTDITERKQAEEKLRQSEENYKTLFNSSVTGMYVLDIETMKVVMGNRAAAEMAGFSSAGEGIGINPFDFVIPEAREQVFEMAAKEFEQGLQQTHELPVIAKDGGTGWISISSARIMHEGRLAALVSFTDITERKRAEEALRQSEENYRALFDSSVIGTFVLDAETMKVVVVNRAATEMLGFSSVEEAVGINPLAFIPSEDRDIVLEIVTKELFEQDLRRTHELRATTKDGREIWVSIRGARIMHGGRLAALVSFTDITERKEMEEKLELLSSVTQQVSDAIIITDADFDITYVNKATQDLFGYSLEEMLKKHMGAFNAEPLSESLEQEIEQTVSFGKLWVGTLVKKRKDGSTFLSECHITPLYDEEGKISSYIDVLRDITERKKAEEALQTEKNKLQSVIDAMADALTIQDTEYNIIFQNEPSIRSTGGDRTGEKCYRAYEGRESICEDCPVEKAFKDGKPHISERQQLLPSGDISFLENTANPIRDARGKVTACLEIGRDITERKKQEQVLADELAQRRLLINKSLDGIVVLDEDAGVVDANQRFADMLGYTLKEVYKLHTWDWDKNFPPAQILEMGRSVDEKGLHLETKHTRKDGSVIDVDISISGIMCGGRKLIFCSQRDVTERNKMEKALKQAAEEWKRTFDSISDAISIHDRDFRIQQANKAFADIFNRKPSQIIGRHCYKLHKGQKPHSGCPHQQTLATKEPAAAEFYESHLGKYLLESTSPIFDDKGEVVATVHITRDITEQKQQNERLMMADRLASIGELASGTAHELNNPLTSIIGFSQLLMEKEVPDDIREDLKLINDEAQRAANVTKSLLTFARKHAPVKQLNQVNTIIEDVLKLRAYEHKVNDIEVNRQLAPNLPEIMADYFQMQQVFMNIIINAEYFITEAHKKGTLTITTKRQNNTVMISFADDGPGIRPENLGRIFDPFFTTKEAGKGTGLGLSICHGIVAEHGGQIYARKRQGKGATIVLELPINNHNHIGDVP